MKSRVVTLEQLGEELVLAPERHLFARGAGVPLGELVVERRERVRDLPSALVLDTTHAKDGVLDVHAAARDPSSVKSAKKLAKEGDLLVSRLRPYLRQIALVHPEAARLAGRPLAVSPEFFVLSSEDGDDLAWLVPFLLGPVAQRALADAQEGGHHPRVPRASLFALRVPRARVRDRAETSRAVRDALALLYAGVGAWSRLLAAGDR